MEQSSKNENTCNVFMNEIRVEDEFLPEEIFEEMGSFQIKRSKNLEMNENNLKKLHAQRVFWKGNNINVLCWAFYCMNDNKEVNVIVFQIVHYILCHNNPILNVYPKTQARKWLIIYNTTNGITPLRNYVNLNHFNILKQFEIEVNFLLREDERQPSKKKPNIFSNSIFSFFVGKEPFKKDDVQQKQFLEDLGILIVKNHLPL